MIKYFTLLLSFSLLFLFTLSAQIKFNSSGGTPDPSAIMEMESTEQGILIPRMEDGDRLGISSPAQGLLVFQTNGTVGFYFYNGSGWDTLGGTSSVTNISNVTNITNSGIAVVKDVKAANVDGGSFNSGGWRQRDLNSIDGDLSFIALGTNSFTLDTGTYVVTIVAPGFSVQEHQCRLYNSSDASVIAVGSMGYSDKFAASPSNLTAVVSVTGSSKTFRIEHRSNGSKVDDGFGLAASWGENVYTQVQIEKL